MEYSIFAVYKAFLERQNKVSGELHPSGNFVIRIDFGTDTGDDWIDHWIWNKDEQCKYNANNLSTLFKGHYY